MCALVPRVEASGSPMPCDVMCLVCALLCKPHDMPCMHLHAQWAADAYKHTCIVEQLLLIVVAHVSKHVETSTPRMTIVLPAGPADMGFSFGLHVKQDYDLPAMMASPEMQQIYATVLEVGLCSPCLGLNPIQGAHPCVQCTARQLAHVCTPTHFHTHSTSAWLIAQQQTPLVVNIL